jgi:alpha-tubulin suppressor-like RCC1 family protein
MRRLLLVLAALAVLAPPSPAEAAAPVPLGNIRSIATGTLHTCALLTTTEVRCWGDGSYGKLGNDHPTNAGSPTPVAVVGVTGPNPLSGVTQLVAGYNHTCALLDTRQVRCWGFNDSGQLGTNTGYSSFRRPQVVLNQAGTGPLTDVLSIDAGSDTTCAVLASRQVRCWGSNGYGSIGGGAPNDAQLPRPVNAVSGPGRLTGVAQVSVGGSTTCARLTNGEARCWGFNIAGQVGDRTRTNRSRPRVVRAVSGPGPLTGVAEISAGDSLTCARLQNRQVRCWGRNAEGGLGNGSTVPRSTRPVAVHASPSGGRLGGVTSIQAGGSGACARMSTGLVRCWGRGDSGQQGRGNTSLVHRLPATVRNADSSGPLTGVQRLSYTIRHACVVVGGGTAQCWGYGLSSNLGDGNSTDSSLPVVVITD